ncbi:LLM class F420-dependent oxidoreductase [Actinoplanes sp. RD1]|uniref:LLM class F420-dependent oxidoreductase n=1 Tax=Actinoplanes sp. RD1 TaxID=3064538 RepID=UPI002741EB3F|nr:LLM class F420-dependent oxidoreductase [Actinoplanes sp. RD1]
MKLGLHINNFTWPGGPSRLGPQLADVAAAADEAGFDRISVMDHVWQIGVHGPPEHEMLEAYTALGFLAAHTRRAKLLTLVTGVTYRYPGLLAKAVTTLDVLSGGRAMLGIGAAWNEEESRGLGLFFPPTAERFERLEETLQICLKMFHGEEAAFEGKHYQLGRLLNSPLPISRPHPPILIGGGGEKKTLRLVAKYADACNLFNSPDVERKLDVLRQHCETEGRDYDDIEKTVVLQLDPGAEGEKVEQIVADATRLAGLGFTVAHGGIAGATDLRKFEIIQSQVVPAIEAL